MHPLCVADTGWTVRKIRQWLLRRRGVVDDELNRVAAAVGVAAQMAGDMDCSAPRLDEEIAERRAGDAERDCIYPAGFQRVGQRQPQMAGPDRLGPRHTQ